MNKRKVSSKGLLEVKHREITCKGMWEIIGDTLLAGEPRYCCVCEGHNCSEAIAERLRAGLPPPPDDAWCKDLYIPPDENIETP